MKPGRPQYIIHVFALLHAAVSLLCQMAGFPDTVLLTMLTIAMTVMLGLRYSLKIEITALTVVLVNVTGFFLGTLLARVFGLFVASDVLRRVLATFLTTEMLGWTMVLFSGRPKETVVRLQRREWFWLLLSVTLVFITRILIDLSSGGEELRSEGFFRTFVFALLAEVAVCTVLYMVKLAIEYREEALRSETEARQAEYRYMILKHQTNPHFLFNSLNILDSLVLEGHNEDADDFIHRLSGFYRYLIGHEGEQLVSLDEELNFTSMYVDLMRVRFQGGFTMEVNVPQEDRQKRVVPCSVQLLVENALKHNAVSEDNPVPISISSQGGMLCVSNGLRPKLTHGPSTGLGQKYIRQQYKAVSAEKIIVEQTDGDYTVKMPLL